MPPKIWAGSDYARRYRDWTGVCRRSLAWLKEVDLYSASNSSKAHASLVFARHFCVPSVLEEGWLPNSKGWSMKPDHATSSPLTMTCCWHFQRMPEASEPGSLPLPKALAKLRAFKSTNDPSPWNRLPTTEDL